MPAQMQQQLIGGLYQYIPPDLRFNQQGKLRITQAFTYNADFVPLAASQTATVNIQIQSDSDFLVTSVARVATDSPAQTTALAFMPATLLITDTGSGRQLMDRATHLENWFGTGQFVRVLDQPFFIRASSTLSVTLANLDTANARVIRLAFHGAKVFA